MLICSGSFHVVFILRESTVALNVGSLCEINRCMCGVKGLRSDILAAKQSSYIMKKLLHFIIIEHKKSRLIKWLVSVVS